MLMWLLEFASACLYSIGVLMLTCCLVDLVVAAYLVVLLGCCLGYCLVCYVCWFDFVLNSLAC